MEVTTIKSNADFFPTINESVNKILAELRLKDVNQLISAEEKKGFIKYVFGNDLEDYKITINLLDLMNNWKLAYKLLNLVFTERNIDESSKHAIKLSNIVYSRYYPQ